MKDFPHVIEPESYDLKEDISLKGNWNKDFFENDNPIVLELGCGKGEYSVSLAKRYPNKNFIGIDIKGNNQTLDKVIRREFSISEGDAFNPTLLRKTEEKSRKSIKTSLTRIK